MFPRILKQEAWILALDLPLTSFVTLDALKNSSSPLERQRLDQQPTPEGPLPSPELFESTPTPAVGHMGCLVQPWLRAHLPQPPSRLQPALLISHLPGTSLQRGGGLGGPWELFVILSLSAAASSFQPSPCAGRRISPHPRGSLGYGGVPTTRLTALAGGLLGKVKEAIEPARRF